MRIVGGKYKGRFFTPNKKFSARPTTDLAKEALFNILSNRYDFSDMQVLDLFSGTGSIGYEFISRGASEVTFVEKNYSHVRFIKQVINELNITNGTVIRKDTFHFIKHCKQQYNIIFGDPPFDAPFIKDIPEIIFNQNILKKNGLLILEHPKNYNFSNSPYFFELRNYGKVNFSFFQNK